MNRVVLKKNITENDSSRFEEPAQLTVKSGFFKKIKLFSV
jgi:hypothetical protein